jgi:hypothetical protein
MSQGHTGEQRKTDWGAVLVSYRWPLALVALALVALGFYLVTLRLAAKAAGQVERLVAGAAEHAEAMARGFLTGNVTETFLASIPEIADSGGGRLEVASAEITETFTRSDERRIFWDVVPLGTTVTEIRVPVTYRYHLRLDDPWRVEVSGHTCLVFAPRLRPTQPPAIHTDGMSKRAQQDWLRFDAEAQLAELERSLTPRLEARAAGAKHLALVREASRRTVAKFVRAWLLREDQWREDRVQAVTVVFADEEVTAPDALEVTLALPE